MKNLPSYFTLAAVLAVAAPAYADICSDEHPTCDELGFTQTKTSCKGKFNACPFDVTKGICINGPAVGDIKYSLKSANHDGWLLCNGNSYNTTTYSKLYNVIKYSYGGSGSSFKVPDYRGFFLKGYGNLATSLSSNGRNANNSVTTPQKEQLPNITGQFPLDSNSGGSGKITGAFSYNSSWCGTWSGHKTGTGCLINFNATNTSGTGKGVYKDNGHVIPGNYAAYIFIYAGK